MGVFDSIHEVSDAALNSGEKYLKVTKSYYKLKIFQIIATSTSKVVKTLLIGSFLFLAVLWLLISATIWLSTLWQSFSLAFLAVGVALLLIGICIYLIRRKVDTLVISKISKDFFNE